MQLALLLDDPLELSRPERTDELVLEVAVANEHVIERPGELARFADVAEPDQLQLARVEGGEEASERVSAADRNDVDALGAQIPAVPFGESQQRDAVARALNEDDGG